MSFFCLKMGKFVVLFLCLFFIISCLNGSSLSHPSPSNPNPSPRESENVEEFQFEEKMEELENFHAEFKDFKSSLVELSAAFRRFHQSVAAVANGSSTKPEPEPEKPDSQSITSCSVAMEILPSPLSKKQTIYPHGNDTSLDVLCDFEVDGGGWTIIQKRTSGPREEFKRNWTDYSNGFGSLNGNFWLGLENIHALTRNGDQELRIQLEDHEGNRKYAKYSNFSISDASDFYRLAISGYSGDATDSMKNYHNGMRFTTIDKDNDESPGNCAARQGGGGWWYNGCAYSRLNGLYFEKGETFVYKQGINWETWKGMDYSLAKTEMKIRKRK